MGRVWSEQNKFDKWLKVELAVCEAWAERGVVPADALPKLREARFDLDAIARYLPEMHHDMTVFLRSLADSLGEESRFIHLGLTSQDVMDTALALQLIEATELLEQGLRALTEAVREKAKEHKQTLCIGRSHGVHAEPTTFGLKLAAWYDELRRQTHRLTQAKETVSIGKISGTVGTHATVPPDAAYRIGYRGASHRTSRASSQPGDGRTGSNLNGSCTVSTRSPPPRSWRNARASAPAKSRTTTRASGYLSPADHTVSFGAMYDPVTDHRLSFIASPTMERAKDSYSGAYIRVS